MLRAKLEKRFESFDIDLLVLNSIVIDPKWPKLEVRLLAVKKMIDLLGGGCGLVVSKSAPLLRKVHSDLGVDSPDEDERREGGRSAEPAKVLPANGIHPRWAARRTTHVNGHPGAVCGGLAETGSAGSGVAIAASRRPFLAHPTSAYLARWMEYMRSSKNSLSR